jgi:hypothetical protein
MAYEISPQNVCVLQQSNTSTNAWLDLVSQNNQIASVRVINNYPQRWEVRVGAVAPGSWDLFNVSSSGTGNSVLISSGLGNLQIPSLGTPPSSSIDLVVDSSGNVYKQSSSIRYKEDVKPLVEDFAKVMALTPVTFRYKGGHDEQIGYVAEDVEAAGLSRLVHRDDEGQAEAVSYKHLGIYAIELLKQQQTLIDELRRTVNALKEKLSH